MSCSHVDYDDYFEKCLDCGMTNEDIHHDECGDSFTVDDEGVCDHCGFQVIEIKKVI